VVLPLRDFSDLENVKELVLVSFEFVVNLINFV